MSDDFLLVPKFTIDEMVAARCLAMNLPIYRVASVSGLSVERVKQLLQDREFIDNVAEIRTGLVLGRDPVRQMIATLAEDQIIKILSSDYKSAGAREKGVIAKVALTVYSENAKAQTDVPGVVTNNVLVTEGGLELLAKHLVSVGEKQKMEEIEKKVPYRRMAEMYVCAPETERGVLNYDSETGEYQCHICGKWTESFKHHIAGHGLSVVEYEEIFDVKIEDNGG